MTARQSYLANWAEGGEIVPIANDSDYRATAEVIVPIISGGDCLGAVVLLSNEEGAILEQNAVKLARLTAEIIANQFE